MIGRQVPQGSAAGDTCGQAGKGELRRPVCQAYPVSGSYSSFPIPRTGTSRPGEHEAVPARVTRALLLQPALRSHPQLWGCLCSQHVHSRCHGLVLFPRRLPGKEGELQAIVDGKLRGAGLGSQQKAQPGLLLERGVSSQTHRPPDIRAPGHAVL